MLEAEGADERRCSAALNFALSPADHAYLPTTFSASRSDGSLRRIAPYPLSADGRSPVFRPDRAIIRAASRLAASAANTCLAAATASASFPWAVKNRMAIISAGRKLGSALMAARNELSVFLASLAALAVIASAKAL